MRGRRIAALGARSAVARASPSPLQQPAKARCFRSASTLIRAAMCCTAWPTASASYSDRPVVTPHRRFGRSWHLASPHAAPLRRQRARPSPPSPSTPPAHAPCSARLVGLRRSCVASPGRPPPQAPASVQSSPHITALLFRRSCGAASQLKLAGSHGQRYRVYVASAHEGARPKGVAVRYVVAFARGGDIYIRPHFVKWQANRSQAHSGQPPLARPSGLQKRPYAKYPPLG